MAELRHINIVAVGDEVAEMAHVLHAYAEEAREAVFSNCYIKQIKLDGRHFELNLKDMSGKKMCDKLSLLPRQTDVFLTGFAVNSPNSLKNVREKWIPKVQQHYPNLPYILVATKIELRDDVGQHYYYSSDEEVMPRGIGFTAAVEMKAQSYLECSAETRQGVTEVFEYAVTAALEYRRKVAAQEKQKKREEHKQAYEKAIKGNFTLNVCPVRFNHIGIARSGKTSFRLRLMGEILNILRAGCKVQPSTGLAEAGGHVFIRSMSTDLGTIQSKVWSILKDFDDEASMLNQFFFQAVNSPTQSAPTPPTLPALPADPTFSTASPTTTSLRRTYSAHSTSRRRRRTYSASVRPLPSKPHFPVSGASNIPVRSTWKKFLSLFSKGEDGKAPSKKDMEETFSIISDIMKDDQWDKVKYLLDDLILLINTDTGGQAEFLDLQANLVLGPSLNFLYRRLVDDLDRQFETYYTNEEGVSTEKEDSTTTVQEILFQTLSSIACLGRSFCDGTDSSDITHEKLSGQPQSKAIFVGTHRDLVTEEEFRRKDQLLQEKIKNTEFYNKDIIEFASKDHMMLAVDNMEGDEDEITEIRKLLEKIIERNFPSVPIPAAWLMLSLCIRKLGVRTMSLHGCEELARKLRISSKELQDALWFLHHYIGVILYYPEIESLKGTVICDIQVVFDSASNIIKNTFTFDKVGYKINQEFREKAQFTLKDVKKAFSCHTDDLIPLESLVDLLRDRNVLAVIPPAEPSIESGDEAVKSKKTLTTTFQEPTYFMPCILKCARADELIVTGLSDSDPPPLMLRYSCGYFPVGVFPALITNLVSQQREDWEMISEGLRKNRVQFVVGDSYDTVTLILHPRFLEIAITRKDKFATQPRALCAHVRGVIESTLETVTSHLNYHFQMQYKFGFECPIHSISGKSREHICVIAKKSTIYMECLQDLQKKTVVPLESHHMVWFPRVISSCKELLSTAVTGAVTVQSHSDDPNPSTSDTVASECTDSVDAVTTSDSLFVSHTEDSQLQPDNVLDSTGHSPSLSECMDSAASHEENSTSLKKDSSYITTETSSEQVFHDGQSQLYPEAPLPIDCTPTLMELICFPMADCKVNLAEKIGIHYWDLGILLLEDNDGDRISAIEKELGKKSLDIVRQVFRLWLQGKGRQPVTWATLIAVLQDVGLEKLVRDIKNVKFS